MKAESRKRKEERYRQRKCNETTCLKVKTDRHTIFIVVGANLNRIVIHVTCLIPLCTAYKVSPEINQLYFL